jgi:hypothetical protein
MKATFKKHRGRAVFTGKVNGKLVTVKWYPASKGWGPEDGWWVMGSGNASVDGFHGDEYNVWSALSDAGVEVEITR